MRERGDTELDQDYSASRQQSREREANFYMAIFLVVREDLEKHELVQSILEARRDPNIRLDSGRLWSMVYKLAKAFHVTPTLMMMCLVDLGWLKKVFSRDRRRRYDLLINRGEAY